MSGLLARLKHLLPPEPQPLLMYASSSGASSFQRRTREMLDVGLRKKFCDATHFLISGVGRQCHSPKNAQTRCWRLGADALLSEKSCPLSNACLRTEKYEYSATFASSGVQEHMCLSANSFFNSQPSIVIIH